MKQDLLDFNTDQPDPLLRFVDALTDAAQAEVHASDATDETVREAHLVVLLCEGLRARLGGNEVMDPAAKRRKPLGHRMGAVLPASR